MALEHTKFGKRLAILRLDRELTMDMMVQDINIRFDVKLDKGLISRWERQQVEPTLPYARIIAEYFNVSLDYLIGTTDISTPVRLLAYKSGFKQIQAQNRKKEEQA